MNAYSRNIPRAESEINRRHRPDYALPLLTSVLMAVGLVVVFAISPALSALNDVSETYYVSKQFIAILIGVAVFVVAGMFNPNTWRKLEMPMLVLAGLSSIAVRLFGEQINGAYRWVQIGGFSFQAAELIKFALIIWMAGFLTDRLRRGELDDWQKTLKPLAIAVGIIGFVVAGLQSDLGSAAVMITIIGAMVYISGMPMKKVMIAAGVVLIGVTIAIGTSGYRRDRLQTFLNPAADCQGAGYQSCQALIAVGSGGMFGLGLANSVQAYGYLPEAANDSIFAIFGEKFGFVGSVTLVGLFILLFARIIRIIEKTPDDYSKLLVTGVLAWLSTQAFINIGAMIGLLPLKGITLPFISYGGTSLIFVAAAIGMVFGISRYTSYRTVRTNQEGKSNDYTSSRRGHGRTRHATVSRRP